MSNSTIARSVKVATIATAGILLATSAGASNAAVAAAPATAPVVEAPPADATVGASAPQAVAVPEAASWREAVASGATAQRPSRAVSARQALVARQATFTTFTLSSKQTRDMRGVERSLYRGKYYNATSEAKRLCVVERESEGFYDVVNPGGNYFGAYQVSRALARGATWMMLKEHKKLMGAKAAKRVLANLRSKPMNTWPRYWQDAAFHTVINWNGTLSGASHWAGGRWHC